MLQAALDESAETDFVHSIASSRDRVKAFNNSDLDRRSVRLERGNRPTNEPASGVCHQFKQTLVGGEAIRMAEADRASEEGETARTSEGGLVIRVQLRGLQPDPHSQTAGAECMKQLTCTRCHLVIGADRKLK